MTTKAFIGDRPLNYEINHIDGDKTNNRAENLEYCTKSENMQHSLKTGLSKPTKGAKHHWAKLKEMDIKIIRQELASGKTNAEIAKIFNVHSYTIARIKNGKNWNHIP